MPHTKDKLSILSCKCLGLGKFSHLQALRFPQFDFGLDVKDGLPIAISHMDMNRTVIVAVEKETISVPLEHPRHPPSVALIASLAIRFVTGVVCIPDPN